MFLICAENPVAYDRKQYTIYMIYTAYIREPFFLLDQLIWLDLPMISVAGAGDHQCREDRCHLASMLA